MAKTTRLGALAAVVGLLAAVGLLIVLTMLVVEVKPAEATFPNKNGRIAYAHGISQTVIYTINPRGEGKAKVTAGYQPSFSPDGKKIAYTLSTYSVNAFRGDIYTINVGGGGKFRVTHDRAYEADPSWGRRQQ